MDEFMHIAQAQRRGVGFEVNITGNYRPNTGIFIVIFSKLQ